jgi:hypothetical protein
MQWRRLTHRLPALPFQRQTPNMVYRIAGGLFFVCIGLSSVGALSFPPILTGLLALIAGIALLAGY